MKRGSYMAELRDAVASIVVDQDEAVLASLAGRLPLVFPHDLPSPVTLAKALTGMGWVKMSSNGESAAYRRAVA